MAAIDLGGGSVQEAFALTDAQAKAAPDPLYVTKLKGGGKQYSVYVHRWAPALLYSVISTAAADRAPFCVCFAREAQGLS